MAEFTDAYESAFGPWPGKSGGQYRWRKFLDTVKDSREIDRLIEFLASEKTQGRLRSKPYVPDCEAALRTLRSLTGRNSGTWDRFASACDLCYGSGWMVLRARRTGGDQWEQTDSRLRFPEAYSCVVECCCSVGEEAAAKRAGMGAKVALLDVRQKVRDYLLEERKAREAEPAPAVAPVIDWPAEAQAKTMPAAQPAPVRAEARPSEVETEVAVEEEEEPLVASDFFVDDADGPNPESLPF